MIDIIDAKSIPTPKLEHIFLGTVKRGKVSGYHCDKNFGDERVYAEKRLYPKSKRVITVNAGQKLFEAVVRDKASGGIKKENHGKSSFFPEGWTRQDVVDCIDRLKVSGSVIKKYGAINGINMHDVCLDKKTGLVIVNNRAGAFPLLKY